jgi:hypothetical protein
MHSMLAADLSRSNLLCEAFASLAGVSDHHYGTVGCFQFQAVFPVRNALAAMQTNDLYSPRSPFLMIGKSNTLSALRLMLRKLE